MIDIHLGSVNVYFFILTKVPTISKWHCQSKITFIQNDNLGHPIYWITPCKGT